MSDWPLPELPAVAILAGGLGTRMRPATERIPKALLPVAGEPFLGHQLRGLARQGIRSVVLCCGHLGGQIVEYAGDGRRFGVHVQYSFDGSSPLGTGGALRRALPLLGETFFVLYGDSYLGVSFAAVHAAYRRSGTPALMAVLHNRGRWGRSNVELRAGRVARYGKNGTAAMEHIDYGLGLYRASVFAAWPDGAAFPLTELQSQLACAGQMGAFEVTERFYEIGSPLGLAETETYLRQSMPGETTP